MRIGISGIPTGRPLPCAGRRMRRCWTPRLWTSGRAWRRCWRSFGKGLAYETLQLLVHFDLLCRGLRRPRAPSHLCRGYGEAAEKRGAPLSEPRQQLGPHSGGPPPAHQLSIAHHGQGRTVPKSPPGLAAEKGGGVSCQPGEQRHQHRPHRHPGFEGGGQSADFFRRNDHPKRDRLHRRLAASGQGGCCHDRRPYRSYTGAGLCGRGEEAVP